MSNICNNLRLAILQSAFQGKLTKQLPEDGKAKDLFEKVKQAQKESGKKLKEVLPVGDDDQLFAIPDSWYWVRIGDIFDHNTGKTKNAAQNTTGESRKYITTSNMYWNYFDFSKVGKMNFKEEELEKYTVKKGDILVCEGGDFGRTAIWNYDEEVCFQNHIHRLRFFYPMNTTFFYWLFFFYKNANLIKGKGIGIQGLSSNALHDIAFPLPPLAEQERIVRKIDELMVRVADLEQSADALASLKKAFPDDIKASLLQAAMQGKLTKQLPEDGNAEDLLEEIKVEKEKLIAEGKIKKQKPLAPITDDEIPFSIPENWQWVRFGGIVDFNMGKTPPRADASCWGKDIPWISIADMPENGIISTTKEKISQKAFDEKFKSKICTKGTLIMSFKLTVGRCSILDIDAVHNEAIISIEPIIDSNHIFRDYLAAMLPLLTNYGESKDAIKGRTLNSNSLNNLLIPLPPLAEQKRIVERLNALMQNINVVGDLIASE